jgi:hypothetical protein
MTEAQPSEEIEELKGAYGVVLTTTAADGRQLICIETVVLPKGCKPSTSSVLLIPQAGRPLIYVKPGIKVPNGVDPRSTSIVSIEGKEWLQFSYTFPWGEETHTLLQFVQASLRRFEKHE